MATSQPTDNSERHNTVFTALANHRRRFTLYACDRTDGKGTIADVAVQVAAWEYDKDPQEITSAERKRVYTSLQQHHLPKLEEAGLVEFDGDTITLTEKAQEIDLYLEIVTQDTIPWSLYYVGFTIVGLGALGIAVTAPLPDPITPTVVGFVVLTLLGISAIGHLVDTRRKNLDAAEVPMPEGE